MIIGLFFISIGLLIKYGKLYLLIAGYNTMSAEEKANYNIKKAANLFLLVMLYMGLIMIIGDFLSQWTEITKIKDITFWLALITGLPFLIWKSNTKEYKMDKDK